MHTLVVIGPIGGKRAYLDLPREEAVRRYREECGDESYEVDNILEFEFEDAFSAYEIWAPEGDTRTSKVPRVLI